MDLSNLKNIDVNDLFNKLKSGGFGDKKSLIKFCIGFGAVFIFLIIYYVFVSPVINAQEEKLKIMSENNDKPVFSIEKLYVKDLSLEVPGAPAVFKQQGTPQIEITMNNTAKAVEGDFYEVLVRATVTAKLEEATIFLVEASQGGIFQIRNLSGEPLEMTLGIAAPNIIFPYLRETISEAVSKAGFPPVLLQPMNFEAVYRARKEEQSAPEGGEATKH